MFSVTEQVYNLQSDRNVICLATPADSSEDVTQFCPDCPLLVSLNNTEVLKAVTAALNEHNGKAADAYLKLLEIGRARIQVIATAMSSLPCKQNIFSAIIVLC